MRLTATKGIAALAVKPKVEQLESWANKEANPLLEQIRNGVNARPVERPTPVTSDGAGTYVTLWTSDVLPQDCIWHIEAHVAGVGGVERASYMLFQAATSIAGTVAALGVNTSVNPQETAAGCDARIVVDVANRLVTVEARDDAATAMQWTAVVQTHEGQGAP